MALDAPLPYLLDIMENMPGTILERLREEFLLWSGRIPTADNLADAIEEIDAAQLRLEQEIAKQSEAFSDLAKKAFPGDRLKNFQIWIDED